MDLQKLASEAETNLSSETKVDTRKYIIEAPVEKLVNQRTKKAPNADAVKLAAEIPTESLLPTLPSFDANVRAKAEDNPPCQPGLVKWHESVEVAKAESRKSGKPVLFFTLLGQLDETFT